MSDEEFIELLRRAGNLEAAGAIADVGAMLGMCSTLTNGRTIGDVRGKYQPQTELGKRIQQIVERAVAENKAARAARRAQRAPATDAA